MDETLRLSTFLSLRSDLARGDLRCLYLAWLAGISYEEYEDETEYEEEIEPPVPAGLGDLSTELIDFAHFFHVDPDLILAAAQESPPLQEAVPTTHDIRTWLDTLHKEEKETLLTEILEGALKDDATSIVKLRQRFQKARPSQGGHHKRRTVLQLLKDAKAINKTRKALEEKKAAEKKAAEEKAAYLARERRLNAITGREAGLWQQIETLIEERKAASYDKAADLITDLRDLAARGDKTEFLSKLSSIKKRHSSKSSFMARLRDIE